MHMGYLDERSNFMGLPDAQCRADSAGVVLILAPYETTSTFGKGSIDGPQAILEASHEVELFDAALGYEPCETCGGIATLTPLSLSSLHCKEANRQLHDTVAGWIQDNRFSVTLGGEHTSIIGAVQAHSEAFDDVTVVQIDAHSDLRPSYQDDPWSHACATARILDFHDDVVQVGIRSEAREEREIVREKELPVFYAHDIHRQGDAREDWVGAIIESTNKRVYITFDCDALDPALIPGTGTPEPGGLTWQQLDHLAARLFKEREVVGFDVSELMPLDETPVSEFTIAKLVYRWIGYRFPET